MIYENKKFEQKDKGLIVANEESVTIKNCVFSGNRVGIDAQSCQLIEIKDSKFVGGGKAEDKYVYGIRFGYSGRPEVANKLVKINRCQFSAFGNPSGDYAKFNRDHISSEVGNTLWIKSSTFHSATDACIDAKGALTLKGCAFANAHRLIRVWGNTTVVAVDCKFTSAPGHELLWFYQPTSKFIAVNCTFDGAKTCPVEKIGADNVDRSKVDLVYQDSYDLPDWFEEPTGEQPPAGEGKKLLVDIPVLEIKSLEIIVREQ